MVDMIGKKSVLLNLKRSTSPLFYLVLQLAGDMLPPIIFKGKTTRCQK
jgi:hypothetical protein